MPHKKDHTWKDVFGGQLINKGKLAISKKVKEIDASDSSWHNQIKNRGITQNIKKGTAGGRIQKDLIDNAGFTKTQLRKSGEKTQAFNANRKKMDNLRKTNPEKYKKLKKEERRKANIARMNSRSSTWD